MVMPAVGVTSSGNGWRGEVQAAVAGSGGGVGKFLFGLGVHAARVKPWG
jgi:hypothetical protein